MAYNLRTGYEPDYGKRRSFIKFNIPGGITANSVTSASLRLKHLSGVAPTVRTYRVSGSWFSGSITWNDMPSHVDASETATATVYSGSWYQLTVTDIVKSWVNGTSSNYGFMVKDVTETDPDHWSTFYSSDAESASMPQLVINYIGYWGCKPYVNQTSTNMNCLEYVTFIDVNDEEFDPLITPDEYTLLGQAADSDGVRVIVEGAMERFLNENFYGRWEYGSLNTVLDEGQWLIAMRTGKQFVSNGSFVDYHFWYRTNSGAWANKHGFNEPSELLPATDLPTTNLSSGWQYRNDGYGYQCNGFYDSAIVYYVLTE